MSFIPGMELRQFDRFARLHLGLVTFEHAGTWGVTRREWNEAMADRFLDPVHRDVARMFGVPTSVEQRILAAVMATGPDSVASHRSSARLWGAERPEMDPVDVILPGRCRRSRVAGVVVHRPRDLEDLRPVMRGAVPVTNPLRTLLDLGAVDPASVAAALRSFVLSGFVTPAGVGATLVRHAVKGRSGVRALRAALDRWYLDAKPTDSELEIQMGAIAARFELPRMAFHVLLGGYEVDFAVTGTRLVVECDGWSTHGIDREQFELDRRRDADLAALGHVVIRVSSRALFRTPAVVARTVARNVWTWAPDVAVAHLAIHPNSILGATRPL
jgi:very-short-patch-repair endonuclease